MKAEATRKAPSATVTSPVSGRVLQRECACGGSAGMAGQCADCAKKKNGLQRKLTVGASNDPLEQEADRVVDQVMAAPAHSAVSGAPPRIQRYTGQTTGGVGPAPPSVERILACSGSPLEPVLRQEMEQRFGHDFSQVRVHSDVVAEQSAREVNANAYTAGHNIVFGAGRFAPETHEGRRLIAHELTHVVQQGTGQVGNGIRISIQLQGRPFVPDRALRQQEETEKERCAKLADKKRRELRSGTPLTLEEQLEYFLCPDEKEPSNGELSYELADAPSSPDPKVRVRLWLIKYRPDIEAAEARFKIDRRAIAGAIAWEAIENVRLPLTPSSVGPGKVHVYKDLAKGEWFNEDTVAKQTEDAGYLPKQDLEGRKNILRTASGAISYIAAIMKAGADIAFDQGGFEIANDPEVLTWYYNSRDLPGWRALIKAKQRGTPFDISQNNMSVWVKANLALLEAAVGKPSIQPTHPPKLNLQKASLDDLELATQSDPLEREADRVAEQMLAAPLNPDATGTPPRIQRYMGQATRQMDIATTNVDRVLASSGRPLEPALKHDMEQRFGHDFSRVRVHSGAAPEQSARDVNAHAYTVGHNIVFGAGRFVPGTDEGRRLIAHELTHVVQQSGGIRLDHSNDKRGLSLISVPQQNENVIQRKPAELIKNYSFIGNPVGGGLNSTLKGKLEDVEKDLKTQYDAILDSRADKVHFGGGKKTFEEWAGIYSVRSWRPSKSTTSKHSSGSAVDVNYDLQPYIATRTVEGDKITYGGEAAGAGLKAERKATTVVYDRAMLFTTNTVKEADISARKQGESARAAYDRVRGLDQALSYYFRFGFLEDPKQVNRKPIEGIEGASDDDLLKAIPTTERRGLDDAVGSLELWMNDAAWKAAHPGWAYTPRQMYFRILRDYEHVRIPMVIGNPVSRPDVTRNPTRGFLHMRPEFVVSMIDVGKLRWGAVDLGSGESGDVHHFDLGNHGGVTPDGTE